ERVENGAPHHDRGQEADDAGARQRGERNGGKLGGALRVQDRELRIVLAQQRDEGVALGRVGQQDDGVEHGVISSRKWPGRPDAYAPAPLWPLRVRNSLTLSARP